MSEMSGTPEILTAAQRYKSLLLKQNGQAMQEMVNYYAEGWRQLKRNYDALSAFIVAEKQRGAYINAEWLYLQERYRVMMAQAEQELMHYSRYAAAQVGNQQRQALVLAEQHSDDLMRISLGEKPDNLRFNVGWNRLPREAVENIAGFLADGSPLEYKFAGMVPEAVEGIKQTIVSGVITGLNPRTIAKQLEQQYAGMLTNTLTVCRTETLRAYRHASIENYRANDHIVTGWIWTAAHQGRTCAACWAMDGTFHKLDEELDDHPNGRCTKIPVTKSWDELAGEPTGAADTAAKPWDAEDEFRLLSDGEKIEVLGTAKYAAWRNGELNLRDIAGVVKSPVWGDQIRVKTLDELGIKRPGG